MYAHGFKILNNDNWRWYNLQVPNYKLIFFIVVWLKKCDKLFFYQVSYLSHRVRWKNSRYKEIFCIYVTNNQKSSLLEVISSGVLQTLSNDFQPVFSKLAIFSHLASSPPVIMFLIPVCVLKSHKYFAHGFPRSSAQIFRSRHPPLLCTNMSLTASPASLHKYFAHGIPCFSAQIFRSLHPSLLCTNIPLTASPASLHKYFAHGIPRSSAQIFCVTAAATPLIFRHITALSSDRQLTLIANALIVPVSCHWRVTVSTEY